jgi:hypothetical protein
MLFNPVKLAMAAAIHSMFNPDDFKGGTTTEQGSTVVVPCPVGEYVAKIEKVDFRQNAGVKDPTKVYTFGDLTYEIDSDEVRRICERDKVTVRQSIIIDVTPDGKGFDMGKGKNVGLNRVREAVGQNVAGQPWSPTMLEGKICKVRVKHRPDENDPTIQYAEVAAVAKL